MSSAVCCSFFLSLSRKLKSMPKSGKAMPTLSNSVLISADTLSSSQLQTAPRPGMLLRTLSIDSSSLPMSSRVTFLKLFQSICCKKSHQAMREKNSRHLARKLRAKDKISKDKCITYTEENPFYLGPWNWNIEGLQYL
jgi:hypothetical protein